MTTGRTERDNPIARAVSRRINADCLVVAVFATVAFSFAALVTWEIGYLTFLLFYHALCVLGWLCTRWYVLRGRDAAQIVERYNRLSNPWRERWDAHQPSRTLDTKSKDDYSITDALWIVGGMGALAALVLLAVATLLSRMQ